MLFADVGNSRLKWRFRAGASRIAGGFVGHQSAPAATMGRLREEWRGIPHPRAIWIASVVGKAFDRELDRLARDLWGLVPLFAHAEEACCGVRSLYRQPERLGVDRWLAMIAASALVQGHCLVVDCGSAVTLDLLDGQGEHRDCVILPGFNTMQRCLLDKTRLAEQDGCQRLAEDTRRAMTRGARLAISSAVLAMREEWRVSLGGEVALLLTGGDWRELDRRRIGSARVRPELVLDGLQVLASEKGL